MIRDLWNKWWWHYWCSQAQYLTQRLDEIDAEEANLREDRKRIKQRLMKATAKTTEYGSISA